MRIFDLLPPPAGTPPRVALLGTCRIVDPFSALAAQGLAMPVWSNAGAVAYSLGEAKQLLDFTEGAVDIPRFLRRFIFTEPDRVPPSDYPLQRRLLDPVEYFIVEMSSGYEVRFRDFYLDANAFPTQFLTKRASALLPWYRIVSAGERAPEDVIRTALGRLEFLDEEERRDTESLLREVRYEKVTLQSTVVAMRRLAEGRTAKWLFVSHFLVPDAPVQQMAERRDIIECLQRAAAEIGAGFFDPSGLVAKVGRRDALDQDGNDPYHYGAKFQIVVGHALLDAALGEKYRTPFAAARSPDNAVAESPTAVAAAAVNECLIALHRKREARWGVDGSGLFEFYKDRLDRGQLVGDLDVCVASFILDFLPRFDLYHVLRAGLGEVAFTLADRGRTTVAFDADKARYAALVAGAREMATTRSWPRGRLRTERMSIPAQGASGAAICVAVQAPIPVPPDKEDAALDRIARYDAIFAVPRLFIRQRETIEEQTALVEKIRARGLRWIVEYPAIGAVLLSKRNLLRPHQVQAGTN